jgi:hypothetical protein
MNESCEYVISDKMYMPLPVQVNPDQGVCLKMPANGFFFLMLLGD